VCDDPDTYVFFDSFHTTTATHAVPARLRTAIVPEPFTIILLCDALDPVRDSLDFVAVWIDQWLHDGWGHSHPAGHRHRRDGDSSDSGTTIIGDMQRTCS